ncbi:MAG: PH domain-containing protein [Nevskia sp.]|nr:PH domain-containing protein [Nevskia sp.]
MSYVDNNLLPGETVLCRGRLHWIIYGKPMLFVVIGLVLLALWRTQAPVLLAPALAFVGFGVFAAIPAWLAAASTELVVTSKRVIAKRGLISRHTTEMLHKRIESIAVQQSIGGRMLGFGTVVLHGTGGGFESIPTIADPLRFRNAAMAAQSDQPQ